MLQNMKFLLVLSVVVVCVSAYKQNMLKANKTPKRNLDPFSVSFTSTCDECKMLVKRFAEAIKDPEKLAELKIILSALCHETSYVEECKAFVSKLDYFIARLEPYLQDEEKVCKHFHMCANSKIEQFHRIGLLYARKYLNKTEGINDLICEECQFAVGELKKFIEEEKSQQKIKKFISEEICTRLGKYQGSCDLMLEEFLPELFEELDKLLEHSKQFCVDLGLCKPENTLTDEVPTGSQVRRIQWLRLSASAKGQPRRMATRTWPPTCLTCENFVSAFLKEMKTNVSIEWNAKDAPMHVCPKMRREHRSRCGPLLTALTRPILAATLTQLRSQAVCSNYKHLTRAPSVRGDQQSNICCGACHRAVEFLQFTLENPDFRDKVVGGTVYYICAKLPESLFNICENLTESFVPLILQRALAFLIEKDVCKENLHLC